MVRFIHMMKIGVVAMTAAVMLVSATSQSQADTGRIHCRPRGRQRDVDLSRA
jgi:hypothetical protein